MLPVAIAEGRAALAPLELVGLEEELAAADDRLAALRGAVEALDQAREMGRLACLDTAQAYEIKQGESLPPTAQREVFLRRRHELCSVTVSGGLVG